ncbi:MAG TPA: L-lactate dehydrogenase, partial [Rubrivivax sp.]|nr:L-lactate dehydrogenase [Rubrivivax sp.]
VTADLVRAIVRDEHRVLTVSRLQDGDPLLADLALSLPAVVSRGGAGMVITPALDDAELAALQHSAGVLRQAWAGVAAPA